MNIEIHQPGLISDFLTGAVVFKITSHQDDSKQTLGMVTTKEDYDRKLMTHQYLPILHLVSFYKQMAYLYGCLNLQYKKPRKQTFVFWARRLRTKLWSPWFTVYPYEDSLFET